VYAHPNIQKILASGMEKSAGSPGEEEGGAIPLFSGSAQQTFPLGCAIAHPMQNGIVPVHVYDFQSPKSTRGTRKWPRVPGTLL